MKLTFEVAGTWDYNRNVDHGSGSLDELKQKAQDMQPGEGASRSVLHWRPDGSGFVAECFLLSGKLDGVWRIVP